LNSFVLKMCRRIDKVFIFINHNLKYLKDSILE